MSNIEADKVTIGGNRYKKQKSLYAVKRMTCVFLLRFILCGTYLNSRLICVSQQNSCIKNCLLLNENTKVMLIVMSCFQIGTGKYILLIWLIQYFLVNLC